MSEALHAELADAAGVATRWKDVHGHWHAVSVETQRYVLNALGLACGTESECADSLETLRATSRHLPALITGQIGLPVAIPVAAGPCRVTLEDGTVQDAVLHDSPSRDGSVLPGLSAPGYHRLTAGDQETTLAIAPPRCFGISDAASGRRLWGLAAQLYSLRRPGDAGLGDFGALRDLVRVAAGHGASAVAISPVHAQFSADPDRFSPYSPSSRMMLNVLHADLSPTGEDAAALEANERVDWPRVARLRLAMLRQRFEAADAGTLAEFEAWRAAQGDALETHARFEALHAHLFGADPALWHWSSWPAAYKHPACPEVAAFAAQHAREIALHAFMQFEADRSLQAAQQAALDAGMPIGLIADLAIGADSGGSHCWSRQEEILPGVSVGAPPDLLAPHGQGWGLVAFNPRGLARSGYAAFLEMLRAAMRHSGGIRIDHAMGLQRLWVIPDGQRSSQGTYLSFPFDDMLRLIALESWRNRCVVLGEDLGTVPDGFQGRLAQTGVLGMRVLWFEREKEGEPRFIPPKEWTFTAAAMTSTHDLATVAGWWAGRDLEWRGSLGWLGDQGSVAHQHWLRQREREALWRTMENSGAAQGDCPPVHDTWPAVDAGIRHVGGSACELAIIPLEDALAIPEQPNLPGTMAEHPNWQRRLPGTAAEVLDDPLVAARLAALNEARATTV